MPTDQTGEGNDKIQYQFHLTDGHVTLRMQDTDGSMHTADSQSRIVPGVWTHVGFTLNRNFHVYRDQQKQHIYQQVPDNAPLDEKSTAVVVGVGAAGMEAARLCKRGLGVQR